MITTDEQITNALRWLEALYSGEYKQLRGDLGKPETGMCCWGVMCYVTGTEYDPNRGWADASGPVVGRLDMHGHIISPTVDGYNALWELNDKLAWTFPQIADYLVKHAETNFIPEVAAAIKAKYENVQ